MHTGEAVGAAARSLLDQRKANALSVRPATELWCSAMGVVDKSERRSPSRVIDPVCGKLKSLFDDVAHKPMPDGLEVLAELLDAALERGELTGRKPK